MELILNYQDSKKEIRSKIEDIKKNMQKIACDFVIVGYHLRNIKENKLYLEDGYNSFEDMVRSEFDLDETYANRYMNINKAYSKEGYSIELKEEYQEFDKTKLIEMLNMSTEDRKLIAPEHTVAQIRETKEFLKEPVPEENLPLFEMTAPPLKEGERTDLEETIYRMFEDCSMKNILNAVGNVETAEELSELINPNYNKTYRRKTIMIFFYDYQKGISYRKMGHESENITWQQYFEILKKLFDFSKKDVWSFYFENEEGKLEEKSVINVENIKKNEEGSKKVFKEEHAAKEEMKECENICKEVEEMAEESEKIENCDIAMEKEEPVMEEENKNEIIAEVDENTTIEHSHEGCYLCDTWLKEEEVITDNEKTIKTKILSNEKKLKISLDGETICIDINYCPKCGREL